MDAIHRLHVKIQFTCKLSSKRWKVAHGAAAKTSLGGCTGFFGGFSDDNPTQGNPSCAYNV